MITSSRHLFIGAHVTPDVKRRVVNEAKRRGVSVSKLVYECLQAMLVGLDDRRRCGMLEPEEVIE